MMEPTAVRRKGVKTRVP